jgi:putative transposase
MAQVCADLFAAPAEFNRAEDRVHLLVPHPPKVALSHLVNSLTGASPRRLRQDFVDRINKAVMHGRIWPPSYFARFTRPAAGHRQGIHRQPEPTPLEGLPPRPEGPGLRPRSSMKQTQSRLMHALAQPLWRAPQSGCRGPNGANDARPLGR